MLFRADLHPLIRDGSVTVAFRCWKRPTVSAGGTLQTPAGLLAIDAVEAIEPESITAADARRAGFTGRDELLTDLRCEPDRRLYRVDFHLVGEDPRVALRDEIPDDSALLQLLGQLERIDARSPTGPWTGTVLATIHDRPGVVAAELADLVGLPRSLFKARVRRLKAFGLTESLSAGYRLSPRGRAVLDHLSEPRD